MMQKNRKILLTTNRVSTVDETAIVVIPDVRQDTDPESNGTYLSFLG